MINNSTEITEPSYVEILCEARLNATEDREKVENILRCFLDGEIQEDPRYDGLYLLIRNSSIVGIQKLGDWIRQFRILDTVRRRLRKSITGNITAIYFNRQAAAMGRLSLVDLDDSPPLGYVAFQIVSDGLEFVIDQFTPKTYNGIEMDIAEYRKFKEEKKADLTRKTLRKSKD